MISKTSLRRAERDDLDRVIEWMEDPDYHHFLYGEAARSHRQIRESIVAMVGRDQNNLAPGSIHLIIDHQERGPIGLVSLQRISWRNRGCTVDFYMGEKSLRGGVEPSAAMYRTAEYCFDELNLHRITANIYAFNRPSWRLLERVGALRELVLKEHVVREGELHDLYCYGLLRPDFDAFREANPQIRSLSLEQMIERLTGPDAKT